MGKFEFSNDWYDQAEELADSLESGKLPGKLGVIQDIVGHWAIPSDERGWMRYGKALLDTVGTLHTYRREHQSEREEGKDPGNAWLKEEGFERTFPGKSFAFTSFVRRALDGVDLHKKTVKVGRGKKRGDLIGVELGQNRWAYFIPLHSSNGPEIGFTWEGPYTQPDHHTVFAKFVRERVWKLMGTSSLMLVPTGPYNETIELSALSDDFDYTCGKDEQNNVEALAKRCKAFLSNGMRRALLFHGPPGTGKSTLARALSRSLKTRTVLLDHTAVHNLQKSAHLIIRLLSPGVLILNDIDRGHRHSHRELLQALESSYAKDASQMLTCLTVNDISQLDPALLRPGRIHEVRKIEEPSETSVTLILDYYIDKLSLALSDAQRDEFLKEAKGFSPADIREFCETAKAVGVDMALDEIARIQKQRTYYAGDRCAEFNHRAVPEE